MASYSVIQGIVTAIIPLLFAITVHEVAHGWVASWFGDKTALMLGRITLNPLKHIDPIGTIILPMLMLVLGGIIFGWAKPVPVSWQNLNHPRRDMALVALAGPISNLLMALLWAAVAKLCLLIYSGDMPSIVLNIERFTYTAANFGILINCVLMMLNLLPIPPLDGSRVMASLLPPRSLFAIYYEKLEAYGLWILLALLLFGLLNAILWPPIILLIKIIKNIFSLP